MKKSLEYTYTTYAHICLRIIFGQNYTATDKYAPIPIALYVHMRSLCQREDANALVRFTRAYKDYYQY